MAGKVLIIDDDQADRIVLKLKLAAACYHPTMAASASEGLTLARSGAPDLILLSLGLRDMPAVDMIRRLKGDPRTSGIPILTLGANSSQPARLEALRVGAEDHFAKPVDETLFMARLRAALRSSGQDREIAAPQGLAEDAGGFEMPATVALVSERDETARIWRGVLAGRGSDRILVISREEALAEGPTPDVYAIDADIGGAGGGMRLLSDLRARMGKRDVPVCVLQPRPVTESAAMAWDLGADEVVSSQIDPAELSLRLRGLIRRKRQSDRRRASVANGLRLAMVDPLTGLYNRRFAMPHLAAMAERAATEVSDMAVLIIDLDRFKSINDRFGHSAGDAVLVEVARRLSVNLRPADLIARIGGEEFLIALSDLQLAAARAVADRLCKVIEEDAIEIPGHGRLNVTISIGLATRGRRGREPVDETMARADRALMASKAGGRNQVTVGTCATLPFAGVPRMH